jgi:FKBP-type peptidyl-prolyl cis-trans isomerase 2
MAEKGEKMTKIGDTVRVHYTGILADGTVFDTSAGKDPLQFTIGSGTVIPGFDHAIVGMKLGEYKTIEIPVKDAYGPHRYELVQEVSRSKVPPGLELKVGKRLSAQMKDGQIATLAVIALSDSTVTLDANHPLAGKDIIFDIELVEVI